MIFPFFDREWESTVYGWLEWVSDAFFLLTESYFLIYTLQLGAMVTL